MDRQWCLREIGVFPAQIREQILVPDLYVLTVESVVYKKRLKREKKLKKNNVYFMQLFSADATIFLKFFFDSQKVKKLASKVVHNQPRPFYSTVQPRPQPRIDFSYYEILGPDICSLICVHKCIALMKSNKSQKQ